MIYARLVRKLTAQYLDSRCLTGFIVITLIAVSKRLFRATVDYLIDQNEDTDGKMCLTRLDYVNKINELFEPLITVFKYLAQCTAADANH